MVSNLVLYYGFGGCIGGASLSQDEAFEKFRAENDLAPWLGFASDDTLLVLLQRAFDAGWQANTDQLYQDLERFQV